MISYKTYIKNLIDKDHYIYKITGPEDYLDLETGEWFCKSYIGSTINISTKLDNLVQEMKEGKTMANGRPRPIVSAIKKFGVKNFELEVLEVVTGFEKARKREKYYIKKYNTLARYKRGYNISEGGDIPFEPEREKNWDAV